MDYEKNIPDGWKSLIEPVKSYMKKYNILHPFGMMNIKEIDISNGVLSIVISNANAEMDKILNDVKDKSAITCMVCGSNKNTGIVQDGSNAVKCYNCVMNDVNKTKKNIPWYSNDESEELIVPYVMEGN